MGRATATSVVTAIQAPQHWSWAIKVVKLHSVWLALLWRRSKHHVYWGHFSWLWLKLCDRHSTLLALALVYSQNNTVKTMLLPAVFVFMLRHDSSPLPPHQLQNIGLLRIAAVQEHMSCPPQNSRGCCCNSLLHSLKTFSSVDYSTASYTLHEK
jgi:hypothetical protein